MTPCFFNIQQFVVVQQRNGNDAVFTDVTETGQQGALYDASFGDHDQIFVGIDFTHRDKGCDFFSFLKIEDIDNVGSLGRTGGFGNFITFLDIQFASIGEEEQIIMAMRNKNIFYIIFFLGGHRRNAFTASVLCLINIDGHSLDVSAVGNRDGAFLSFDQVFQQDFIFDLFDVGSSFIAVFTLDFQQIFFNDGKYFPFVSQNAF